MAMCSNLSIPTVKDTVKVAFFKGLIACSRYHRTDKHDKRDGYLITFCTIGYDNGCYVDLIIDRLVEMKHEHFIEGAGIIKPGNPICIDVFWYRLGRISEPHKDFSISYKTNKNKKPSNYDWNEFLQLSHDNDNDKEYESDNDSDDSDDSDDC
jgi:hypothetical protein